MINTWGHRAPLQFGCNHCSARMLYSVCHTQNAVNVMWERCTCCQQRGKSQVSYNAACGGGRIDLHSTANARLHLCTVFTASCDVLSSPHHRGVVLHRGRACAVRRRSFHAEDDVCHSLDQCTTPLRRSRWNGFTSAEGTVSYTHLTLPTKA